jgi:hypothetical protein
MALLDLHSDRVALTHSLPVQPVVISDWWCTTCGRSEAAEDTRLCPECAFHRTRSRAALARQLAELAAVLASAALLVGAVVLRHRSGSAEERR